MKNTLIFTVLIFVFACASKDKNIEDTSIGSSDIEAQAQQDSIIAEVFRSDTYRTEGIFSPEWQVELDKALTKDSTIARLWQQKAMPLFKQGKYELGMPFLDKAVKYDEQEYLEYRAFMKCIFAKQYRDAIIDFEEAIKKYGDNYVMDHSYSFHIALSKIQLNQFAEAEMLLLAETERQLQEKGENLVHHLDLFYLGISQYEQNKYEKAIASFDKALKLYSHFSDVQAYKAICLAKLEQFETADSLWTIAETNGLNGYTINEDNAAYERYPYQWRW